MQMVKEGNHRYTDKEKKEFLKRFRKNYGNVRATCEEMGIGGYHRTINNWKKDDWFRIEFEDIIRRQLAVVEENAFEMAVEDRNPSMLKFLLSSHPIARKEMGYAQDKNVKFSGEMSYRELMNQNRED